MSQVLMLGQKGLEDLLFRPGSAADSHSVATDKLFMLIFWISTFFFVLLMVLMVAFVVKYRRRPGRIAPPSASHNTVLELAWTIIPLAILAVMFFKGFWGYMDRVVAPGTAIEMNVVAQKWSWTVTYPNGETSPETTKLGASDNIPVFYVPANLPVMFKMTSTDVMHSFWVPDFRSKFDVFPNRYTNYWFTANAPGPGAKTLQHKDGTSYPYEDHWLFCAEYCGDKHSEMAGIIRVVSEADYKKVVYEAWGAAKPPVEIGRSIWKTRCASCHSVDGSKNIGPTWKDLYAHEVAFTDGSVMSSEAMTGISFDNYIRESILAPAKKVVAGYPNQMSSFAGQLSEAQISGVIAYIKSISAKAPKEEVPAEGTAPAPAEGTAPAAPSTDSK